MFLDADAHSPIALRGEHVRRRTEPHVLSGDDVLFSGRRMLYTIAVVLLVLWLLGLVSSYTVGGFIHVLLVIAIVMVLLRVISGRKPI